MTTANKLAELLYSGVADMTTVQKMNAAAKLLSSASEDAGRADDFDLMHLFAHLATALQSGAAERPGNVRDMVVCVEAAAAAARRVGGGL